MATRKQIKDTIFELATAQSLTPYDLANWEENSKMNGETFANYVLLLNTNIEWSNTFSDAGLQDQDYPIEIRIMTKNPVTGIDTEGLADSIIDTAERKLLTFMGALNKDAEGLIRDDSVLNYRAVAIYMESTHRLVGVKATFTFASNCTLNKS